MMLDFVSMLISLQLQARLIAAVYRFPQLLLAKQPLFWHNLI